MIRILRTTKQIDEVKVTAERVKLGWDKVTTFLADMDADADADNDEDADNNPELCSDIDTIPEADSNIDEDGNTEAETENEVDEVE
ncbi:hypothetical protein WICMUC_001737 [Wickerhamomyces mucosus]|uniref:Uncharacterized protein n=1 Tax=Wickerhamomyces mucosus TaxID=1378264 RepID=A0A9P8PUI8_9ASCO|nr:hypothetical protein WICMUC_001737 [Wickerhamomyces mucosus]